MVAFDPKAVEPSVLKFWADNSIYAKAKKKVKGKEQWYFLDGPPYTSGRVHIGTAWNKALKDMILRYKRMSGFDVWDRAGYDMHGLPTENKVKAKLNLKFSEDIVEYGIDKFNTECENFAVEMMGVMNESFERLGVWMDFENAYKPITRGFVSGQWMLAKRAHEKERLYEGLRTMPWCKDCQTTLAKHDLEYATVSDDSIFLKFKIKNEDNEYFVIWTTTPWTIPMNLAIMVNPNLDYVKVEVEGEKWIVAKALVGAFMGAVVGKEFNIIDEFKGETLEGIEYEHPLSDLIPEFKEMKEKSPKLHTVLMSAEYVDTSAGSGLVHCAPGCGPEDYEVGHRNGLPAWNIISKAGVFPSEMKEIGGLVAKDDDKKFIELFKERGALIASTKVEHDYPHCQRCHNAVVFRTTTQWFFKVEDLKDEMVKLNKEIYWVPEAGFNAFESWLENLRDNSITRQNFWGTPIPIWKCECGEYDVFGSVEELEEKSKSKVEKLHRPWIDEIKYKCDCGKEKIRVTDVFDVWMDSGTVAWNCLDYTEGTELFDKLYPAEFILEGKDQIRGWYNALMINSIIVFDKPSFKAVYMHGFINDALGRKMSKSLGNQIKPEEVVDDYGADALRYYQIGSANPGLDQKYNTEDAKFKMKQLGILWNVHNYLLDMSKELTKPGDKQELPEKYIISRLHSTIRNVTEKFEQYKLNEVPGLVEELYLDLSRTYIQLVREKAATGSDADKNTVVNTIYEVLMGCIKMLAPVAPFVTEQIYQNLKNYTDHKEESIHLLDWPKANETLIDEDLEAQFNAAGQVVQAALYAREQIKTNVRWPVKSIIVLSTDKSVQDACRNLADSIKTQTNVKAVKVQTTLPEVQEELHPNSGKIGKEFKQMAPLVRKALETTEMEEIKKHLDSTGSFRLDIEDGDHAVLTEEHFTRTRTVPEHLIEAPFSGGIVYLNNEEDNALVAEGFSREITRRIQDARKKSGLEKNDEIELYIEVKESLMEMLMPWKEGMKEKVNAKEITVDRMPPTKKYDYRFTEEVKEEVFSLHFEVV
jgi:isoleucyl-tRNA synthetase